MIFNSVQYLIFFAFAALITASLAKRRRQMAFLLLCQLPFLLLLGRLLHHFTILRIRHHFLLRRSYLQKHQIRREKKFYLILALLGTLGQLALFKYPEIPLGVFRQISLANSFGVPQDLNYPSPNWNIFLHISELELCF